MESGVKNTAILFTVVVTVTFILAVANQQTAPLIAARKEQSRLEAVQAVLDKVGDIANAKAQSLKAKGNVTELTKYTFPDGSVAYSAVCTEKGYSGDIMVMAGLDGQGRVIGIKILQMSETAGLGAKAAEDKFLNRFIGKGGDIALTKGEAKGNEVQAITGATVTSNAVIEAVNSAIAAAKGSERNEGKH